MIFVGTCDSTLFCNLHRDDNGLHLCQTSARSAQRGQGIQGQNLTRVCPVVHPAWAGFPPSDPLPEHGRDWDNKKSSTSSTSTTQIIHNPKAIPLIPSRMNAIALIDFQQYCSSLWYTFRSQKRVWWHWYHCMIESRLYEEQAALFPTQFDPWVLKIMGKKDQFRMTNSTYFVIGIKFPGWQSKWIRSYVKGID